MIFREAVNCQRRSLEIYLDNVDLYEGEIKVGMARCRVVNNASSYLAEINQIDWAGGLVRGVGEGDWASGPGGEGVVRWSPGENGMDVRTDVRSFGWTVGNSPPVL